MDASSSKERQSPTTEVAPTMEKLELQFSNSCHKGFVIFDHSARKRTMLLHPAFKYDHSCFEPKITDKRCDLFAHLQNISDKAVENMLNIYPPPADPSIRRARLVSYRETMESAFAALQKMKKDGFCSFGSNAGDGVMAWLNEVQETPAKSNVSGNGLYKDHNDEIQSQYENTEDIDALLSSDDDDELDSTGHSPQNNVSTENDDRKDLSSKISRKKRKFEMCDPEDDGADFSSNEADSSQVLPSNCEALS